MRLKVNSQRSSYLRDSTLITLVLINSTYLGCKAEERPLNDLKETRTDLQWSPDARAMLLPTYQAKHMSSSQIIHAKYKL